MRTRLCAILIFIFMLSFVTRSTNSASAHKAAMPDTVIAADLAIGVPDEALGITSGAGAVNVLYNSGDEPVSLGSQFWNQGSPGVGTIINRASFGKALAVGDFDDDGHDDLAIGAYEASPLLSISHTGAVYVLYAQHNGYGLSSTNRDIWTQDSNGVPGEAEEDDWFGYSLAVGDFNGDGYDDLAIGAPIEAVGSLSGAGAVNVIYGSASGLTGSNAQLWDQDSTDISGTSEAGDNFGYTLAAGDFDSDGYDDLAIGAWLEGIGSVSDAGSINVIYGSASRLTATGNQLFDQDSNYVGGSVQANAHFSEAMAVGDFDDNGYDDLAVGAPGYSADATHDGALCLIHGTSSGLSANTYRFWSQNDMADPGQNNDDFAAVLAAGDFTNDGHDDLAIGAPSRTMYGVTSTGTVYIMEGDQGDLAAGNSIDFTQAYLGGDNVENDYFGVSLAVGHLNADVYDDLAIGIIGKDVNGVSGAGIVGVVEGGPDLVNPIGLVQFWSQDSPGVLDTAETFDQFGSALAIGNFGRPASLYLPLELRQ
jgi:hypothetical protein